MKLRHFLFFIGLISFVSSGAAQTQYEKDKEAILKVMDDQQKAWSNYDLEGFMEGYWKSDDLKFYGAGGLVKGWQATLDRYKRSYPTQDDTGKLTFEIVDVSEAGEGSYTVMGKYFLERNAGNANGVFMIIFKKIDGQWKIVADMSCG